MSEYPSFSEEAVQSAISSARDHYADRGVMATQSVQADDGHLSILADCIEVEVKDGKVCIKLPLGLGKICIPIPIKFSAKLAKACVSICSIWGIPTGVKVTISIGGIVVATQSFGRC